MQDLLTKVKANMIINYDTDDDLIQRCIDSSVSYAEAFQNKTPGFYTDSGNKIPETTLQAIIMLSSHYLRKQRRWHRRIF